MNKNNGLTPHLLVGLKKGNGFTPHLFSVTKKGEGFIALISVIVITMILLGTTATLGMKGFLDRFNILEGEAKEISAGLASACVESARIKIARDPAYDPTSSTPEGEELVVVADPDDSAKDKKCTIVSYDNDTDTVCVNAIYKEATTNYRVELDEDFEIDSMREVTKKTDC